MNAAAFIQESTVSVYRLKVNHYDFVALHSMWIVFLKGLCILVRVEIIHKSKFLPGTVEKNSYEFIQKFIEPTPVRCRCTALTTKLRR